MTELERLDLFRRRGYLCEICHENQATDLHHCLFRRDKHKPQLNNEFNYECLCRHCHMMGYGDTFDHRCAFYIRQVERYGLSFEMWLEEEIKPLYKIKRFEFVGNQALPAKPSGRADERTSLQRCQTRLIRCHGNGKAEMSLRAAPRGTQEKPISLA